MKKTTLTTMVITALACSSAFASTVGTITTLGTYAQSHADNTVAIGSAVTTNHENSIGIGHGVVTNLDNSIGIGNGVVNNQNNSIGIGNGVLTNLNNNIAIGNGVVTHHENSIGLGYGVTTNLDNNIAIGSSVVTNKKDNIGIGHGITVNGESSVAIGYGISTSGTNAIAIGNLASVAQDESVAIGHGAKANTVIGTSSSVINNNTHNFAGATPVGTVSVGDANKERTIMNVAAGRIADNSTDAINGSQLKAVVDEINTNGNNITDNSMRISDLEHQANNVSALSNRVDTIDTKVNRLGASSAALSGLHPLDFNRNDKASYAVSYGHYRNANAVALGAFYRPNERVMLGLGASLGSENQYTANIAFKFGKGSDYLAEAKDKDARIARLERLVNELVAKEAK